MATADSPSPDHGRIVHEIQWSEALPWWILFRAAGTAFAPTVILLLGVAVVFYLNFGWPLVGCTAIAVVAYIWITRAITEWRTTLREQMNRLDGQALSRAVDSLLNYETVKYFAAEAREEARYAQATRAYADAAVKSENSLGMLNIAQALKYFTVS